MTADTDKKNGDRRNGWVMMPKWLLTLLVGLLLTIIGTLWTVYVVRISNVEARQEAIEERMRIVEDKQNVETTGISERLKNVEFLLQEVRAEVRALRNK